MFSEKACRFQIAMMPKLLPENMQYPDEIKAYYMTDMPHVRKETFYNMYRTYMMNYTLKENVKKTTAQVMYWYGEKEMKCVKNLQKCFSLMCPLVRFMKLRAIIMGIYHFIFQMNGWKLQNHFSKRNKGVR